MLSREQKEVAPLTRAQRWSQSAKTAVGNHPVQGDPVKFVAGTAAFFAAKITDAAEFLYKKAAEQCCAKKDGRKRF